MPRTYSFDHFQALKPERSEHPRPQSPAKPTAGDAETPLPESAQGLHYGMAQARTVQLYQERRQARLAEEQREKARRKRAAARRKAAVAKTAAPAKQRPAAKRAAAPAKKRAAGKKATTAKRATAKRTTAKRSTRKTTGRVTRKVSTAARKGRKSGPAKRGVVKAKRSRR